MRRKNQWFEEPASKTFAVEACTFGDRLEPVDVGAVEGGPAERQWSDSSSCGGPVGSGWVRGREGRPRVFRATLGWVTSARTRRLPPQGQSKTLKPQVLRSSRAQSSRGRTGVARGGSATSGSFSAGPCGRGSGCSVRAGTTWERARALGPKTPKYLVRWTRGFTISALQALEAPEDIAVLYQSLASAIRELKASKDTVAVVSLAGTAQSHDIEPLEIPF